MKATRLNAPCSGVEYYKAHGMDAQEIFRNQDDFAIADNKKLLQCTLRGSPTIQSTHQRNLYKVKIFVECATASYNFYHRFLMGRSEGREEMLVGGKRGTFALVIFVSAVARCMIYAAGIMIARAIILFIIPLARDA